MSILVNMDEKRQRLCLEVAWEIDEIARVLPKFAPYGDDADQSGHFLVRAMAGRLLRLSKLLMGALADECEDTESLERIISLDGGQG